MKIVLRDYQVALKEGIYNAWGNDIKNVLAISPTGSGKAMTLCTLADELAKQGYPTTIMVHRKELVAQLCMTLAQLDIPHNIIAQKNTIKEIMQSELRAHGKQFYDYRSQITVVSVDTLLSRADKYKDWCNKQRVWILDEAAHMLKDNKWGECVGMLPNAIGVGFTATPQRLDKKGLGRHAFGLFDIMIVGPTVRELIDRGYLSKFKIVAPKSDYRDYLQDDGNTTKDYTTKARNYASLHSHIIGDVVDNYKKFAMGTQAIVFADSIEAAQRMEAEFIKEGIPAKLLTGETPSAERFKGVMDFADNKTKVLLNVDLFDEGFDILKKEGFRIIDTVIIARPTKSLSKFLQQCGRGLRPADYREHSLIIDHVGNVKYHGLPDKIRMWTLDNIVRKRDTTNLMRICMSETCNAPFDRTLDACPFCGNTDKPYTRNVSEMSPREALKVVDGDMELLDPETIRELEKELNLEDPLVTEMRVARVAGKAAGIKARRNQQERIEMQKELAQTIALWAGKMKTQGLTDRQTKKRFMIEFSEGITVALSLPRRDMEEINQMVKDAL